MVGRCSRHGPQTSRTLSSPLETQAGEEQNESSLHMSEQTGPYTGMWECSRDPNPQKIHLCEFIPWDGYQAPWAGRLGIETQAF